MRHRIGATHQARFLSGFQDFRPASFQARFPVAQAEGVVLPGLVVRERKIGLDAEDGQVPVNEAL
jgi:hypothetical protein